MCERKEINGVEKLVPSLKDKKNYVIHIQALNQVLQHGLRLDRIHRAIEFDPHFISFIINSYYTIIKKIVVKRVNEYNVFKSTTNTMFKI